MKRKALLISWINICTVLTFSTPIDSTDIMIEMPADTRVNNQSAALSNDSFPQVDKMPEIKEFVKAEYPADLVKKGIQGTVSLELLVNESGSVDSVNVLKGLHPVLDSAAKAAAKNFKFTPAIVGNDAVAVLLQYDYRFTIEEAVDTIEKTVNFEGKLLELGTRNPISDAMVVLTFNDTSDSTLLLPFPLYLKKIGKIEGQTFEDNKLVAMTDSTGSFRFYSLPSCSVEVTIVIPGYEAYKTNEVISRKEAVNAKYYVKRQSYTEYDIVVYGKAEEKEVSKRQLTVQEIQKIPGLGGDAVKAVQAMPGVARPSFASGAVVVRGAPSWDSRYYLDGVLIPNLYHLTGLKSTYNSDVLKGVDFYPGGFGTRYGGAIAGVIELQGREGATDRFHGSVDISSLDGTLLVEGPITNKISILAVVRRSFFGEIISGIAKRYPNKIPMTISTNYWDYVLRSDAHFSKNNHLFFTLFGSGDNIALILQGMGYEIKDISNAQDQFGSNQTFNLGLLGWDYSLNGHLSNSLRYSFTKQRGLTSQFGYFKSNTSDIIHDVREQISYIYNDKALINAGFNTELTNLDIDLAIPEKNGVMRRGALKNWLFGMVGAYLNLEWKPLKNLQIIPGIRYDYFPELKYNGSIIPEFWNYNINGLGISGEPSVRLTGRYAFVKNQTLKTSIGNYSQTPQPIGLAIHETWGDPMLPSTKAAQYMLGHEWQITDFINSDVQFYYNKQWNIPVLPDNSYTISNQKIKKLDNNGEGRMYGIEVMLRHIDNKHFFGWLSYTLSRTERYNHFRERWQNYSNDQTQNLQMIGSWHLPTEWDIGFRVRYVTGNPMTPIINRVYKENGWQFVPTYGESYSARVDPFFQIDFRVDKKFIFKKWICSAYLDLQNINYFFYQSPELEIDNYDYTDKVAISMPPLIGIGYKFEF